MTESYIYEQPTNERIRAFLRLEKLFRQYDFHLKQGNAWNNSIAIDSIIELLAFTNRYDIKLEALKELERQHTRLERLSKRTQIDQNQLESLLNKQKKLIVELKSVQGQLGQNTQSVELLSAIKQKSSLPGCICDFDLPSYQYWQSLPEQTRKMHLQSWFKPFSVLDQSIHLILDILRHSVEDTEEVANSGFFQKSIDTNQAIQLLRIRIEAGSDYYPEISAGKHRFSIRFMKNEDPAKRPEQCSENINFKLNMCII
ncbi:MAG: cell division protein ZapD [Gammaproteobacteria bacterium]|nr:cell division protein ZapD [Gammaproteobacteria bacterium]MCW8922355.1 cell division protein ZapD [Gammaproteobacteria bacterium]